MESQFSFGTLNYLILFSYLALMLGVGFWFARRQTSTEEYFLAGRRMPWLVVALSMFWSDGPLDRRCLGAIAV
jgi:SSS family solute:Na+ symporter